MSNTQNSRALWRALFCSHIKATLSAVACCICSAASCPDVLHHIWSVCEMWSSYNTSNKESEHQGLHCGCLYTYWVGLLEFLSLWLFPVHSKWCCLHSFLSRWIFYFPSLCPQGHLALWDGSTLVSSFQLWNLSIPSFLNSIIPAIIYSTIPPYHWHLSSRSICNVFLSFETLGTNILYYGCGSGWTCCSCSYHAAVIHVTLQSC